MGPPPNIKKDWDRDYRCLRSVPQPPYAKLVSWRTCLSFSVIVMDDYETSLTIVVEQSHSKNDGLRGLSRRGCLELTWYRGLKIAPYAAEFGRSAFLVSKKKKRN
jgi:hypothetical protein